MPAGDRQQVGAVREIGLVSTVYAGSPIRGAADHRRRQNATDKAIGDQVLGVVDRRRYLALQSDGMPDSLAVCCIAHPDGFVGITVERPFAIDVLPGLDCGHGGQVVIGHLHADRDQIDIRMLSQLFGIAKRQRHPVMPCRFLHTALISKSGSSCRAGIWAIDANPRLGFAPTIPTRIFLLVAMDASLISGACSYRCTSSIMIPSGPRMKARRKPGLRVSGPIAISAPFERNSSTAASTSSTVKPICSKP